VSILFVKLGADWDGFAVNPKEFHEAGDAVVVEGGYVGTHKVTGKHLDTQMTHVWRLRYGKVTGCPPIVGWVARAGP
jgi:ketosteroid isomerase-like protein